MHTFVKHLVIIKQLRAHKLSQEEVIEVSLNGLKSGKYDMIYLEYSGKCGDPTVV